jgi:hypothetical protein
MNEVDLIRTDLEKNLVMIANNYLNATKLAGNSAKEAVLMAAGVDVYTSAELRQLASHFEALADWLDKKSDELKAQAPRPWPLYINPEMDRLVRTKGFHRWSCTSPSSNNCWIRQDGLVANFSSAKIDLFEFLREKDAKEEMGRLVFGDSK